MYKNVYRYSNHEGVPEEFQTEQEEDSDSDMENTSIHQHQHQYQHHLQLRSQFVINPDGKARQCQPHGISNREERTSKKDPGEEKGEQIQWSSMDGRIFPILGIY